MPMSDLFQPGRPTFSFEFFPPKTPQASEQLYEVIASLKQLSPSFVSVTYGAGGSTRQMTHDLVERILAAGIQAVPHLTCVGHQRQEIEAILQRYAAAGVGTILALAGDPPKDWPNYDRHQDHFQHAIDLVKFIRSFQGHPDKQGFGIGVAAFPEGHPATPNRLKEMDYLKAKADAGADYLCTQLFFDNRDFYDFRDRCRLAGIRQPIIAGIMPVTSVAGMQRMAELAAGCRFPAALLKAINRCENDPKAVERVGIHWASEQCRDLLDHEADGIHFYTLNRSDATKQIYLNLGLGRA